MSSYIEAVRSLEQWLEENPDHDDYKDIEDTKNYLAKKAREVENHGNDKDTPS